MCPGRVPARALRCGRMEDSCADAGNGRDRPGDDRLASRTGRCRVVELAGRDGRLAGTAAVLNDRDAGAEGLAG